MSARTLWIAASMLAVASSANGQDRVARVGAKFVPSPLRIAPSTDNYPSVDLGTLAPYLKAVQSVGDYVELRSEQATRADEAAGAILPVIHLHRVDKILSLDGRPKYCLADEDPHEVEANEMVPMQETRTRLKFAADSSPGDPKIKAMKKMLDLKEASRPELIADLDAALKSAGYDAAVLYYRGRTYLDMVILQRKGPGKSEDSLSDRPLTGEERALLDRAYDDMTLVLGRHPQHYAARLDRARIGMMLENREAKSIQDYTEALRATPQRLDLHKERGVAYAALQDPEAVADFRFALSESPTDITSILSLGTAYVLVNNSKEAIRHYSRALDQPGITPRDRASVLRARSEAFWRTAILEVKPGAKLVFLADALEDIEKSFEGIDIGKNRRDQNASDSLLQDALTLKANILFSQREYKDAASLCGVVFDFQPENTGLHLDYADLLSLAEKFPDALAEYENLILDNAEVVDAYLGVARVRLELGTKAALEKVALEKAAAAKPKGKPVDPQAIFDKAKEAQISYREAIDTYNEVLRIEPKNENAREGLALASRYLLKAPRYGTAPADPKVKAADDLAAQAKLDDAKRQDAEAKAKTLTAQAAADAATASSEKSKAEASAAKAKAAISNVVAASANLGASLSRGLGKIVGP